MNKPALIIRLLALIIACFAAPRLHAGELSGLLGLEGIVFTQSPRDSRQDYTTSTSFVIEAEYVHEWDGGNQLIAFSPFLRIDQRDSERTHFDVRELLYEYSANSWELRLGLGKVFWGVIEFQHLIDIINQTDLVENLDREDKLGQPMVNLSLIRDWGTVDFFVLPFFRERQFPGRQGRLRTHPPVDEDFAQYESSAKEKHVDFAVRYSHFLGDWDFGLSHFYGTSRDPRLIPGLDEGANAILFPFYDIINQTSVDVQATKGNMLWKLEALHRSGQGDTYNSFAAGFEYTFVGVFESSIDIGVLGEYHYDDRGESASSIFEDDIGVGSRIAFNDVQSSEVLAGIVWDRNTGGLFINVEASRRLGDSFVIELESRFFADQSTSDPAFSITRDDHIKLFLSYNY